MHGLMTPADGGGGGGSRLRKPFGEKPSGTGYPAVPAAPPDPPDPPRGSGSQPEIVISPMPVVLTVGTIIKLASVIMVPLLGVLSAGIYFFHKTNVHIEDTSIHLTHDERPKLETKVEAVKARNLLEESIKREVKLQAREIKQDVVDEQKVQIKKLGSELKMDQRLWGERLLGEMKQTRKDVRER